MSETKIVVLGAGVSGLTSALLLSRNEKYSITVVARHMPGDYDIEFASPWAGANYEPFSTAGTPHHRYERDTWPELKRLARDTPAAGIHFQRSMRYRKTENVNETTGKGNPESYRDNPWFKDLFDDFRRLNADELPSGVGAGTTFTSVCINTAIYLPWLLSQCLKNGIIVKRGTVAHVTGAAALHHSGEAADLVINCTGLSALKLGGVQDSTMFPIRGQTVLVRNEPTTMASMADIDGNPDEVSYVMNRAAGGGCVLGGCVQKDSWESQPDQNLAVRIMQRAIAICPSLVPDGQGIEALSIVRHSVGLRPARRDGIRLELESLTTAEGKSLTVVHNYGHAGYGYQTSYGCSQEVVRLVDRSLGGVK